MTETTENLTHKAIMDSVGYNAPVKRQLEAIELATWVHGLAPWEVISHLTFKWEASFESGRKCYEKFMRKHLPRVSYFYALEQNPSRDGCHVHALWADAQNVYRREAWQTWFNKYGRARIEPVNSAEDVSAYCAKYCSKAASWWNVKLQWHRIQRLNNLPYRLEPNGMTETVGVHG